MHSSKRHANRIVAGFCVALLFTPLRTESQEELDRKLTEAIDSYRAGVFTQAIAKLQEVITLLERTSDREPSKPKFVTAHFYMGMSFAALGDDTLAREQFKSVARLDPDYRLDPNTYAPRIIQLFNEARAELSAEPSPPPKPPATEPPTRTPAAPTPAEPAPAKSKSKLPYILAGVGGGVAAGVALLGSSEPDPATVDNDGDGASESQGDCNDADPQTRPNGSVDFTIDFAFTGSFLCSTRNARQQVYRIRNNSCQTVTVTGITRAWTSTGPCSGGESNNIDLNGVTSIPPGQTGVIRNGTEAGRAAAFCCSNPPCTAGSCTVSEGYAVSTSQGIKTVGNSYTMMDPDGRTCPPCTDVFAHWLTGLRASEETSLTTSTDPGTGQSSGSLVWESDLSASGASAQVVINQEMVSAVSAGRFQGTAARARTREYLVEAQIINAGSEGTWRLTFPDSSGFDAESLVVIEGEALEVSPTSVLFRVKGQPGERMVLRLRER